jgi:hypothetical protein
MKRFILAALGVLLPAMSMAAPVRKDIEASMVVTGNIQVTTDGAVSGFSLDRPNDLPDVVKSLASQSLPHWRFEPVKVDGQPVSATSKMRLRFVTRPTDDGNYTVTIRGASFGEEHQDGQLWFKKRSAPQYPMAAVSARVTGTVILLLKVDREGKVTNVAAERVNLGTVGTESEMRMFRGVLADACVRRARGWQFTPPTKGPDVARNEWYVRVPVQFNLSGGGLRAPGYGQWLVYVPGPKEPIDWVPKKGELADEFDRGNDTIPDDGLQLVGSGIKLLTPLG